MSTLKASDDDLLLTLCLATRDNRKGQWHQIASAAVAGRDALDSVADKLLTTLAPTGSTIDVLFTRHFGSVMAVRSELAKYGLALVPITHPAFPASLARSNFGIPFVVRSEETAVTAREPIKDKLVGILCPPDASLGLLSDLKELIPRVVKASVFVGASSNYGLNTLIHGPSLRRTGGTAFVAEAGVLQMLQQMQLSPDRAGFMLDQIITGGYLISSYWPTDKAGVAARSAVRPHLLPLLAKLGIVLPGCVESPYVKDEVGQFVSAGTPVLLPRYFLTQPLWQDLEGSPHVICYDSSAEVPQLCDTHLRLALRS